MNDAWDMGMTWIDDTRVAVEWAGEEAGAGGSSTPLRGPLGAAGGVRVPGAAGRYFSDGIVLFSADAEGLHAWDPGSGERLRTDPACSPAHRHRPGNTFLELGVHARTWQGEGHR